MYSIVQYYTVQYSKVEHLLPALACLGAVDSLEASRPRDLASAATGGAPERCGKSGEGLPWTISLLSLGAAPSGARARGAAGVKAACWAPERKVVPLEAGVWKVHTGTAAACVTE